MIKAVFFDLDGVLVDAVDWHFSTLNQALSLFGFNLSREAHDKDFNGLPTIEKLKRLSEKHGLPVSIHSIIWEMKQNYTLKLLAAHCRPSKDVNEILEWCAQHEYKLAVCSNSNRKTVETIISNMEIRDYFDTVLSANDVRKPKPSSEIYELAFSLLGVRPEETLIIEDSKPGIEAAKRSNAHVLEVLNPQDLTIEKVRKSVLKVGGLPKIRKSHAASKPIEIIIPMAGLGTRFTEVGFKKPKPLINVINKPMIQWVVENVRPKDYPSHFSFVCNEEHLRSLNLQDLLRDLAPSCSIFSVKNTTAGAACTVMLANSRLQSARPVLIANSDQWVQFDIDSFLADAFKKNLDGSILTFRADDPKWSFAKLDEKGFFVTEVAEKKPISSHATVGIYYFKRGYELSRAIQEMIRKDIRTQNEFYLCPVYNELIAQGKKIRIYEIPQSSMHGLGTPEDLIAFLKKVEEPAKFGVAPN